MGSPMDSSRCESTQTHADAPMPELLAPRCRHALHVCRVSFVSAGLLPGARSGAVVPILTWAKAISRP